MTNFLFFLIAFFSTLAGMNIYFYITLTKGRVIHKGKIKDANNDESGFVLKIQLKDDKVVDIRVSNEIENSKFLKFIEKNINNFYEVVEIKRNEKIEYIHNGSYLNKGIIFSIASILFIILFLINN